MPTIQFTNHDATRRASPATLALMRAAVAAEHAPCMLSSQPWVWQIGNDTADLCAGRDRRHLPGAIHDRLLVISCGAALHHMVTALAGVGVTTTAIRFPDPANPDVLARVAVTGDVQAAPAAVRLHRAIALRRDDSARLAGTAVARDALKRIGDVVGAHGARLHVLSAGEVPTDGNHPPGTYVLVSTAVDGREGWLAAGEALSAALLTATVDQLVATSIRDPIDWPVNGSGHPMVAFQIGEPLSVSATDFDQFGGGQS